MRLMSRLLLALLLAAFSAAAHAQQYPSKPIRMVVSIAAGSVTDVIMRAAAAELQPRLGQPLVIENIGGAAGILGGKTCAQAPGDGYTICVIYHSTMSFNPLLFSNLPYNPDDMVPVARLFFLVEGLFVSSAINVNSVAELKTLAQGKPESLNFATLGEGSYPDLFLKWLNNQWGSKIVAIPYRGGGPAAQALAANDVQVTRFGVGNFAGVLEAGKVKALAVTSARRSASLPNVPTLAEAGVKGVDMSAWYGIYMPANTPRPVQERVHDEVNKVLAQSETRRRLDAIGGEVTPMSQAQFIAFHNAENKRYADLVQRRGIKPD